MRSREPTYEPLKAHLEGPTALATSATDETAPARILNEFAKKADQLELKAGVVEGTYYDADGIKVIATIPGREELLGKAAWKHPVSRSRTWPVFSIRSRKQRQSNLYRSGMAGKFVFCVYDDRMETHGKRA